MSTIKGFLRPYARAIWKTNIYAKSMTSMDQMTWKIATLFDTRGTGASQTLLMSPAGDGNIGDHAMLHAFLENCDGPITVLTAGHDAATAIASTAPRITVISMRGLFSLPPIVRIPAVFKFSRLLHSAKSFTIHGADTMDGSQISASLARLSLCRLATLNSVPSAILGFSWSDKSPSVVNKAVQTVSEDTYLYPRDPKAFERLSRLEVQNLTPVADMAFSLSKRVAPPTNVAAWTAAMTKSDRRFMILNISGLIATKIDQRNEIRLIISTMHNLGYSILFLPHVFRNGDDDLTACLEAFQKHAGPDDLLVDEVLKPEQVRQLASEATATVTGRMHLSILTLSVGTPAIALSTAGKVEGLFELFGQRDYVVNPVSGFGRVVAEKLATLVNDRDILKSEIDASLPAVRELSKLNFSAEWYENDVQ